jgi:hypothetical protein
MVHYQAYLTVNRDVEGLHSSPLAIDHIYDSSNDAKSIQEQANEQLPPIEEDDEVEALEVSIPVPPTSKKRGYLKGSKNRTINNTLIKNQHITRSTCS